MNTFYYVVFAREALVFEHNAKFTMVLGEAGEMLAGWAFRRGDAIVPNTASWILTNTSGVTYEIRVSWPLCWTSREIHNQRAHIMYELPTMSIESASRWP